MALHRDIYWVGRQWAVTGFGLQACNQKQKGKFDVEASRLWQDGVLESIRAEPWLNVADFEKAVDVARQRFPPPPRKAVPPKETALGPAETALKKTGPRDAGPKESPKEAPKPAVQTFAMRIDGWPAKFVRPWRIRIRR
jgi:hypothetical protein